MASSQQWFTVTSSFRSAVELINEIEVSKLNKLLSRIITSIQYKDEKPFTDEEEVKLRVAFNLSAKQIESIIDTISFILEQAVYHIAKPATLIQQLEKVQLNEDKVECFTNVWQDHGAALLEIFRKRSLAPRQLDTINWEVRLQTAQCNKTKVKLPSAVVELGLVKATGVRGEEKDRLQYDFTHDELYKFFQQLENIQVSLDSLNK